MNAKLSTIKVHFIPGQGRQGDVLVVPALKPFDAADLGKLVRENTPGRVTLALGEVTGHAHAFYPARDVLEGLRAAAANDADATPEIALYELKHADSYTHSKVPGIRALRLRVHGFLRHEEHAYQSFPPGDYLVIQQHVGDEIQELRRAAD